MLAWAARAIRNASPILARNGNARDENTGAAVKTARTRRNGQRMGDTQAINWASLIDTTAKSLRQIKDAGMASMVRLM